MFSQNPSFRFEIEKFWKKKKADYMLSKVFVAGGCEWYLSVYPKGYNLPDDHLSVYLYAANPKSLRTGWERNVSYYFIVLNHRNTQLHRSPIVQAKFDATHTVWGFNKLFPLNKLKEEGFTGKGSLIVEVYVNVIEAVDGESEDVSEKETVHINGFQVSASQVVLVKKIFAEHPDIALGFKPKNQVVKTAYMNVLLDLINTLNKPSESHSEAEIIITQGELRELEEVGFKIDWLKSKLDNVFMERKKDGGDGTKVKQLEERVKNLEEMEEKVDSVKRKIDEVLLEMKKAKAGEPRVPITRGKRQKS